MTNIKKKKELEEVSRIKSPTCIMDDFPSNFRVFIDDNTAK